MLSPLWGEKRLQQYADTALRTAPDFSATDKAYSSLMSNPSLFARGGSFVDPSQAQQDAGSGYLQSRGQIGQDFLSNQSNLAGVAAGAGGALGQVSAMQTLLNAMNKNSNTNAFSAIMGGLL
jgi:hypothetical protein